MAPVPTWAKKETERYREVAPLLRFPAPGTVTPMHLQKFLEQ
jgi:hypothetical protein